MNTIAAAAHAPQMSIRIDAKLLKTLPEGTIGMLMQLPAAKGVRKALLADFGIPEEVIGYIGLTAQFDTRDTERALAGSGIAVPPLASYADKLWDYWERKLDPDRFKDRSFEEAVNGKTVLITGASSGIGRAAALKIARAGGIPLLVGRSADKLEDAKRESENMGSTAYAYSADISDPESVDELVQRVLADHPAVDILVNNAGRSIRRSIALSYDPFHDFERTIGLNYLGTIKLIMGLLPQMRDRRSGLRGGPSQAQADQHPPGHVRRALRPVPQGRRPNLVHRVQSVPRVGRLPRSEGPRRARVDRAGSARASDAWRALVGESAGGGFTGVCPGGKLSGVALGPLRGCAGHPAQPDSQGNPALPDCPRS